MAAIVLSALLLLSTGTAPEVPDGDFISSSVNDSNTINISMNRISQKDKTLAVMPRSYPAITLSYGSPISGHATWYCMRGVSTCHKGHSGGMYAAAGASLRVGNWRGSRVRVCAAAKCVTVTLIDWCACGKGRVIDLYSDAFRKLAPTSRGVLSVTVYAAHKEKRPGKRPTPVIDQKIPAATPGWSRVSRYAI